MTKESENRTAEKKVASRRSRLSLRLALVLIAIAAVSLGWYREYGMKFTRTYSIHDLMPDFGSTKKQITPTGLTMSSTELGKFDPLIAEIKSTVRPGSWDDRGGSGTITPFLLSGSLIVRQDRAAHRQIAGLLDRKRREVGGKP